MSDLEIIADFRPSPMLDTDFDDQSWRSTQPLIIDRCWNGQPSPPELRTIARVLWSKEELLFGFECGYTELDLDQEFDLNEERYALWDRDVCEAFVRSPLDPHEKYYREFEVAPTGQWCDLIIDRSQMSHDWRWRSGMRTASRIDEDEKIWKAVMAIPFAAFGCRPQANEIWQANLFRISRFAGERQYLSLSPTFTEIPNFHLPERFVNLRFLG